MLSGFKIRLAYETAGTPKLIEFRPVSYSSSSMKSVIVSLGVPQRIKQVFELKSFKLESVTCANDEGLNLQFVDTGFSVNGKNLFLHFDRAAASRDRQVTKR